MIAASPNGKVEGSTLYDGRYSQTELVDFHLALLKFLLKEGDLYLSWSRCEELWDTLVSNPLRYGAKFAKLALLQGGSFQPGK